MTDKPETPIAYLWRQLETLLSEPTLELLRKNYDERKHAYERAAKIRQARRELANYQRMVVTKGPGTNAWIRLERKIASRLKRIKMLEEEHARWQLDNLADAMVEDILNAPDGEILEEFIEDGGDPDKLVADMRALFDRAKAIVDEQTVIDNT